MIWLLLITVLRGAGVTERQESTLGAQTCRVVGGYIPASTSLHLISILADQNECKIHVEWQLNKDEIWL